MNSAWIAHTVGWVTSREGKSDHGAELAKAHHWIHSSGQNPAWPQTAFPSLVPWTSAPCISPPATPPRSLGTAALCGSSSTHAPPLPRARAHAGPSAWRLLPPCAHSPTQRSHPWPRD